MLYEVITKIAGEAFAKALVACLNAEPVQARIGAQMRHYGGGLRKIEPRDLAQIAVPDLRSVAPEQIAALGQALGALNDGQRGAQQRLDRLVEDVVAEVAADEKTEGNP